MPGTIAKNHALQNNDETDGPETELKEVWKVILAHLDGERLLDQKSNLGVADPL